MSTPINDGGPAFPSVMKYGTLIPGMSLRDWFAGQALGVRINYGANVREKELAQECYAIADAMIAEREKGKP